jgi:nucleoside-diphosphate-sugar epimerase
MTKKILITGADGFIGSHLVDNQLARGNRVRALDLHNHYLAALNGMPNLEVITGDFTNPELAKQLVEGIDTVYHLASAHLDVSLPDEHYRAVNVDGTLNLVNAAHQTGVRRFVHCSSVGVIGDVQTPPADETTPCHPTNIYEQTKWAGEQAALIFAKETGFELVVARPAWVYGPRCPRTQKLFRSISKGRFVFFGNGANLRHPIYISDAVRGLELCAETMGSLGEVFILAGEKPVTATELANTIATTLGVAAPSIHLPLSLGSLIGYGIEMVFKLLGRRPPFSARSVDFFQKDNAYNIRKAKEKLGFEALVSLEEGLAKSRESIFRRNT